ncbi:hypothetical protein ACOMHN_010132 [Nucella lapillus]
MSRTRIETAKEVVRQVVFLDRKRTRTPGLPRGVVDNLLEYQAKEGAGWMTDDHVMGNIMDVIAAAVEAEARSNLGPSGLRTTPRQSLERLCFS